ncbi:MAG: succinate dehydrogenase cytochrome b subunit [Candidatus Kapabacteria bacterium]|nr:succinate dehydrogenase cytochrome b subunit [Candidatus Kapabacteria bacterium]
MVLFNYLKSTILSKVVMAVTGVLLVLFLFGHMLGNLQVFIGSEAYNSYSQFLQSLGEILWLIRIVLFIALVLHIITSIRLKLLNRCANPTRYEVKNYVKATLTARTMIWTGIMIFCFLAFHLAQFTLRITDDESKNMKDMNDKNYSMFLKDPRGSVEINKDKYFYAEGIKIMKERHDTYKMVVKGFRNPLISLLYVVAMVILVFHLNHAIQSAFQTLGLNHPNYWPCIQRSSFWVSLLIGIGFCLVPLSIMLGFVGAGV